MIQRMHSTQTHPHVLPRTYARIPESVLILELITDSHIEADELVYYQRLST